MPTKKTAARRPKAKAKAKVPPKPKTKAKAKPEPKPGAEFVPRIVVFACNWCSYAGADNAGVNRIQYSPHFRVIRTMCSGRVHPSFVLRAFEKGADGVLVSGCHIGDCHYIFGNERAIENFEKTKALVKTLGLEEGRVRLEWISAAEGPRFGQVIDEFIDEVRKLGRSPLAVDGRSPARAKDPGERPGGKRTGT